MLNLKYYIYELKKIKQNEVIRTKIEKLKKFASYILFP